MHRHILGSRDACEQQALSGTPGTFWCKSKTMKAKYISSPASEYRQLEDVVGCKWSVSVLQAVGSGISRPGALERHIDGISTKVLSERLRKLTRYGLLDKQTYAEVPPRTEYALTANGKKPLTIIAQIRSLDDAIRSTESRVKKLTK